MACYLLTGKVLNIATGTNIFQNYVQGIKANCKSGSEADLRNFLSCFLKSILDYFLKISIQIKEQKIRTNPTRIKLQV